jgi:osmoprotectant transport system permease protein
VIRQDLAKRHPEVRKQLERLSGKITAEDMRKMNFEVSENLKAPTAVAESFLRQKGLIQ